MPVGGHWSVGGVEGSEVWVLSSRDADADAVQVAVAGANWIRVRERENAAAAGCSHQKVLSRADTAALGSSDSSKTGLHSMAKQCPDPVLQVVFFGHVKCDDCQVSSQTQPVRETHQLEWEVGLLVSRVGYEKPERG